MHAIGRPRRGPLAAALLGCAALAAPAARAEVSVGIHVGIPAPVVVAPPPLVVAAPPTMVYLPGPAVYVAVGIPYDLYYLDGRFYHCQGGRWFWSRRHRGPWVALPHASLPPGLRKFKLRTLHRYRDREFERYRARGPRYRGHHFVASGPPGLVRRAIRDGGPPQPGRPSGRPAEARRGHGRPGPR